MVWKSPQDMAGFNRRLKSTSELEGTARRVLWMERLLLVLGGTQASCALAFLLTINTLPPGDDKAFLVLTVLTTAASGLIGLVGVLNKWPVALHWYFLSQVWALTQVVAQVVRSQMSKRRSKIFCAEVEDPLDGFSCIHLGRDVQIGVLIIALVDVYLSMFVADLLASAYAELVAARDQMLITHFVWLMRRNSLSAISKFEGLIHAQFEDLVALGYLKLKM